MDEELASVGPLSDFPVPLSQVDELADAIASLDGMLLHLKRLNAIFKETRGMMTIFADNSREGIVLVQDSKFVWANKATSKISGYSFEEIRSVSVPDIVMPAYRDKLVARMQMVLAGDTSIESQEWPILRKDRMVRYVRIYSYRVMYQERPAIVSFFYDITENKKQLDESMMRAEILDSISDHVALVDMGGNIVYVNDTVVESSGFSKEDLLKMNIFDLTAPELRKQAEIRFKQVSEHKELRFTMPAKRRDGTLTSLDIRSKIIKQGGRQLVLGMAREVQPPNATDAKGGSKASSTKANKT